MGVWRAALFLCCASLLAVGAAAWGACADEFCESCPVGPATCRSCGGRLLAGTRDVVELGLFAGGSDGACVLCHHKTRGCIDCDGATGRCTRCNAGLGLAVNGSCTCCQVPGCELCSSDAAACDWCSGRGGGFPPAADGSCSPAAAGEAALEARSAGLHASVAEAVLSLGRKWLVRGVPADSAA